MPKTDAEIARIAAAFIVSCRAASETEEGLMISAIKPLMERIESPEELLQVFVATASAAAAYLKAVATLTGQDPDVLLAGTLDHIDRLDAAGEFS